MNFHNFPFPKPKFFNCINQEINHQLLIKPMKHSNNGLGIWSELIKKAPDVHKRNLQWAQRKFWSLSKAVANNKFIEHIGQNSQKNHLRIKPIFRHVLLSVSERYDKQKIIKLCIFLCSVLTEKTVKNCQNTTPRKLYFLWFEINK